MCVGGEELEGLMAGLVVWVIHSQLELSNGKHPPLTLVVSPFSKRSRSHGSKQLNCRAVVGFWACEVRLIYIRRHGKLSGKLT